MKKKKKLSKVDTTSACFCCFLHISASIIMLINYPFELVAPFSAIASILLLPLGPLLVPRFYLIFLIIYFTFFLYTQINHLFKFYITTRRIKRTIRNWNSSQRLHPSDSTNVSSAAISPAPTPTREGYSLDDEHLVDMEASLRPYEDSQLTHAFIIPNYSEPEALLRDTIKRLANHRYGRHSLSLVYFG
jgi:hypothetical protein